LAKQLGDIQSTTFSIDAIGSRICSSWDTVAAHRFDVVIVGAGMFGAYCAEKLFRRDNSNQLRILVLEAGPFFFQRMSTIFLSATCRTMLYGRALGRASRPS
jgi:hypothetical protein